jgi:two-component system, OmpR family, sensor kinase
VKYSRVEVRPDTIARAFLDFEGRLQAATPAFQQSVEVPPAPLPTVEPALWSALGMQPDAQHPGTWSRGGLRWVPSVEPLGRGLLLTLHPAEQQKTIASFLSIAGHDIRGPLATVRSYAALLASPRFSLEERARSALGVMLRNVDRALTIWEQLAESWRADVGALQLDLREEALRPMLETSGEVARAEAGRKSLRLEVDLPKQMPRARVDADRLAMALAGAWALVLERSRSGAPAGLSARVEPGECLLTFWDVGPALTPEEETHIFDRGWQAVRARELGPGFRMALAGALMRAHGGRAWVGSLSGRTLFHFALPLVAG